MDKKLECVTVLKNTEWASTRAKLKEKRPSHVCKQCSNCSGQSVFLGLLSLSTLTSLTVCLMLYGQNSIQDQSLKLHKDMLKDLLAWKAMVMDHVYQTQSIDETDRDDRDFPVKAWFHLNGFPRTVGNRKTAFDSTNRNFIWNSQSLTYFNVDPSFSYTSWVQVQCPGTYYVYGSIQINGRSNAQSIFNPAIGIELVSIGRTSSGESATVHDYQFLTQDNRGLPVHGTRPTDTLRIGTLVTVTTCQKLKIRLTDGRRRDPNDIYVHQNSKFGAFLVESMGPCIGCP